MKTHKPEIIHWLEDEKGIVACKIKKTTREAGSSCLITLPRELINKRVMVIYERETEK